MIEGYKWTDKDGFSWYEKFGPWEVGKSYEVKDVVAGDPCGRGIHIGKTISNAISYGKFPGRIFKLRSDSDVLGSDDTKWRVAKAEVLEEERKTVMGFRYGSLY